MYKIVVTDIHVITRLYRIGLLKYFDSTDVTFYITDICYHTNYAPLSNDKVLAKKLVETGLLEIVKTDAIRLKVVEHLHQKYKPKFIVRTISALALAQNLGYKILSDDELLREIAEGDMKISVRDKEWLVTSLVNEIATMGIVLDLNLVKELI